MEPGMSDWIEQLERLTRLHREGALTDSEFASQKARVLEAAGQDTGNAFSQEASGRSRRWLYAALGAVALGVIGVAAWLGSPRIVSGPALTVPAAIATPAATADPAPSDMATEAPAAAVLDDTLAFAAPVRCAAGDTLERVYKKLEAGMDLGSGQGLTVSLDAFVAPLQISAKSARDRHGAQTARADLWFPAQTTWHGLLISRVTTSRYYPPGTDGTDSRTVNFLEPPEKVRKALVGLGFKVPVAPGYAPIEEPNACGGSMQIETRPGGSALVCTWSC